MLEVLAEQIDFVVGVDTHEHSHTAAQSRPSEVSSCPLCGGRVGYHSWLEARC
jgi:hypothetical protein